LAVVIEQHGDGRISRHRQENFYRLATDVADAEVIVSAANAGNTEVTERIGDVAGLHFAQVDVGELHRLTRTFIFHHTRNLPLARLSAGEEGRNEKGEKERSGFIELQHQK